MYDFYEAQSSGMTTGTSPVNDTGVSWLKVKSNVPATSVVTGWLNF
jgi:hypothetical protein